MAKSLSQQDVRQYALVGAQARLDALRTEMQSLLGAFPELARKRGPGATRPAASAAKPKARRGRRRAMSAEERREVSERMKRYWAARRKEKNK